MNRGILIITTNHRLQIESCLATHAEESLKDCFSINLETIADETHLGSCSIAYEYLLLAPMSRPVRPVTKHGMVFDKPVWFANSLAERGIMHNCSCLGEAARRHDVTPQAV